MRSTLAFALALALAPTPFAAADESCTALPDGEVCYGEYGYEDAPCGSGNGFEYAETYARAELDTPASPVVAGWNAGSYCYSFPGAWSHANFTSAYAYTGVLDAWVFWSDDHSGGDFGEFSFCFLTVWTSETDAETVNCVLGPPNPGWGDVLP